MSESQPTEGLDLEQDTNAPAKGTGNLLDEAPKAVAPADEMEAVDFDDEEIYIRPGELSVCGEKTPNIKHRFTVLPDPTDPSKAFLRRVWTHYVAGKGHAKCLSKRDHKGAFIGKPAFCCEGAEGPSNPRLGAVVVEYTCCDPKTGKFRPGAGSPETPLTFEIKALLMTQNGARSLSKKAGEIENPNGGIEGIPLKVHEVDYFYEASEGKKGLGFERISPKASYTKVPALQAQVLAQFEPFKDGKALAKRMSRTMNVNQMREHLGISGGSASAGSTEESFQDL